jgi:hypothetical protein
MVEMVETAIILSQSSHRSLLILDEVGRGTSTYDGLAIARAVVEHIHNSPKIRAKTLFATHYHELTEIAQYLPHIRNYNVAVTEEGSKVIFLHKIIPGAADKSYGIHVARLAGVPRSVNERAKDILAELEAEHLDADLMKLAVASFLRALVPEHRPPVPEALDLIAEQAVFDAGAHAAGGTLRAQGQTVTVAILEAVHLLFHDVRHLTDGTSEQLGLLDNRHTHFAKPVGLEHATHVVLDKLPARRLLRQDIIHAPNGL